MRFVAIGLVLSIFIFIPGFAFGALTAPVPLYPLEEDSPVWKGIVEFRWESTNSPFYRYSIDLPEGEQKTGVTSSTLHRRHSLELGEDYRWRVSSCSDQKGTDCGPPSATQTFAITAAPPEVLGGLIPCGRLYDDTITTPGIDESGPCGFSHIFLLLKNLLDFVLWKLGLLVIAIMAVLTGAVSYFSFGGPGILVKIKSMWRSLLVGYLLALFAWLIVNLLLQVLGFQTEIFGAWWELPF